MRPLYEIEADLIALDHHLESAEQIGDDEGQKLLQAFAAGLKDEAEKKIDALCALVKNWDNLVAQRKEEAKRMRALAERDEAKASWLKDRLKDFMAVLGKRKVEGARFTAAIQKNGGLAPMELDITRMGQWPEDCTNTIVEPNREKIRERLEAGEQVAGCSLLERGESLRIK